MKTMTCNQLGGACDLEFTAESWDDMASQSQQHGAKMAQESEPAHLEAMAKMSELMKNSTAMSQWMEEKRQLFESLPST